MPTAKTPQPLIRPYRYKPEQKSYARDIDTYVKPQERYIAPPAGRTSAESLAFALRDTSPILMKYFKEQEAKKQQELIAQGERLQKESDIRDWNQLVRERPEYEKYNPYLREGFERQAAVSYAADFANWLQTQMLQDQNLASMTDPNQIDEYTDGLIAAYMKQNLGHLNDRAVQGQFITYANEAKASFVKNFTNKRLDEALQEKYDMYQTSTIKGADAFIAGNVEIVTGEDQQAKEMAANQLAAEISFKAENAILDVSNPKRVNDATIEAALTWYNGLSPEAEPFGRMVIEKLTGRGGTQLVSIARYQEALEKVTKQKHADYIQQERDRLFLEDIEKKDKIDAAVAKYAQTIVDNPTANHSKLIAQVNKEFGPDAAAVITSKASAAKNYSNSFNNGNGGGKDPMAAWGLFQAANQQGWTDGLLDIAVSKRYITPKEALYLRSERDKPDHEMSNIISHVVDAIETTVGIDSLSPSEKMRAQAEIQSTVTQEGIRFNVDFISQNNRKPTYDEKQKHMINFANRQINDIEKRQTTELEQKQISEATGPKQLPKKLTAAQLQYLIDEHQKNPETSMLTKIRNTSWRYQAAPISSLIQSLAASNGIKIEGIDNTADPSILPTTKTR